ncbi:MAG TPA: helix-turn-helix domain-containing protein [Ilumatobacter sp.]|nr:helix-turn-helix domain-containing protein [Ilumatobacter sp.]
MSTAHPIWFLLFDGVQSLDVSGPFEVFAGANGATGRAVYAPRLMSLRGGVVTSESGLTFQTEPLSRNVSPHTTLVLPGGGGARRIRPGSDIADAATRVGAVAERVLTVCTGAYIAAAAGLTTGRRVTTHWAYATELAERAPDTVVEADPLYVRDGDLWSSAGVTAGIDLALAVVEHDHGAEVAQLIARHLVMFLRRPGGQSQFATPVWTDRATTGPIQRAQHRIDTAPGDDHRLDLLARQAGMSTRHFARCFTAETGMTPGAYVARVRVEAARRALETTPATVEAIARQCGFGTAETLRRTFHRQLGVSPDDYRSRFRLT